MEQDSLKRLLEAKKRRRRSLANLPIEEKIRVVVQLQQMAAPILRQRGKTARCWELTPLNRG
jgi:hypothetical protein